MTKELFEKNLNAFERYQPVVFHQLKAVEQCHSELVFDDEGNPDIHFRGQSLYGKKIDDYVAEQMGEFEASPRMILINPPQSANVDDISDDFLINMMRRCVDEDVQFQSYPSRKEPFFLLVLGIGLGRHVEALDQSHDPKSMVLYEPNIEFLYHSLHVMDWESLMAKYHQDGRSFYICTDRNIENANLAINSFIRGISVSFLDGTKIFQHYPSAEISQLHQMMLQRASTIMSGLGFVEDEEYMIRNAYFNFRDRQDKIVRTLDKRWETPVFLIGCGPSLNRNLKFLKENQDKAIYVSCGTALSVLLNNGIRPDIHVELENIPISGILAKQKKEKYGTDDIMLIASMTCDPGVFRNFKQTVVFYRNHLTACHIFANDKGVELSNVGPTVANTALSAICELGFKNIYFMGVDWGTRVQSVHHAAGSDYDSVIQCDDEYPIPWEGNFGGKVWTHSVFVYAISTAEKNISKYKKERKFFNCADGVKLNGVTPIISKAVNLPENSKKSEELAALYEDLYPYQRQYFDEHWEQGNWAKRFDDYLSLIEEISKLDVSAAPHDYLRQISIIRSLVTTQQNEKPEMVFFRGTFLTIMMCVHYYGSRIADETRREDFYEIVWDEFRNTLNKTRERTRKFISDMENFEGDPVYGAQHGEEVPDV